MGKQKNTRRIQMNTKKTTGKTALNILLFTLLSILSLNIATALSVTLNGNSSTTADGVDLVVTNNGLSSNYVYDWRINGTSLFLMNIPFEVQHNSSAAAGGGPWVYMQDYTTYNNSWLNSTSLTGAWTQEGYSQGGYNFDGASDVIGANWEQQNTFREARFSKMTILMIVKFNETASTNGEDMQLFKFKANGTITAPQALWFKSADNKIEWRLYNQSNTSTSTYSDEALIANKGYCIVAMWDGIRSYLIINGEVQDDSDRISNLAYWSQGIQIGADFSSSKELNGTLGHFALANRTFDIFTIRAFCDSLLANVSMNRLQYHDSTSGDLIEVNATSFNGWVANATANSTTTRIVPDVVSVSINLSLNISSMTTKIFGNNYDKGKDYLTNVTLISKRNAAGFDMARLWIPYAADFMRGGVCCNWTEMDEYIGNTVGKGLTPLIVFGGTGYNNFTWMPYQNTYPYHYNISNYTTYIRLFIQHYDPIYDLVTWKFELQNEIYNTAGMEDSWYFDWLTAVIDNLSADYPNYQFGGNINYTRTAMENYFKNVTNNTKFIDYHMYGGGTYPWQSTNENAMNTTKSTSYYVDWGKDCKNWSVAYGKASTFKCIFGEYNWNAANYQGANLDHRQWEPFAGAFTSAVLLTLLNDTLNGSQTWSEVYFYREVDNDSSAGYGGFSMFNYSGGQWETNYQYAIYLKFYTYMLQSGRIYNFWTNNSEYISGIVARSKLPSYNYVLVLTNKKNDKKNVSLILNDGIVYELHDVNNNVDSFINNNLSLILNPYETNFYLIREYSPDYDQLADPFNPFPHSSFWLSVGVIILLYVIAIGASQLFYKP